MKSSYEYSGMLYSLASEIRRDEGCVTKSAEQVEEAAERIDVQTITISVLTNQRDELLQAKTSMTAQYHSDGATIKRLEEQSNGLLTVLINVRNALESVNEMGDGPIVDTIWYGPAETLFDYMDAELDKFESHSQPEKQAKTEPRTKCNTPNLCREYGRACDFGLQLPETSVPALVFYPAESLGEEVAP